MILFSGNEWGTVFPKYYQTFEHSLYPDENDNEKVRWKCPKVGWQCKSWERTINWHLVIQQSCQTRNLPKLNSYRIYLVKRWALPLRSLLNPRGKLPQMQLAGTPWNRLDLPDIWQQLDPLNQGEEGKPKKLVIVWILWYLGYCDIVIFGDRWVLWIRGKQASIS